MEYTNTRIGALEAPASAFWDALRRAATHLHDHVVPHSRNHYQPHLLHHRTLGLFSLLLLSVKIATIAVTTFGTINPALSSAISADNILRLTNESRITYGVAPLSYSAVLEKAAQAKAEDMLAKGYFAHNTPDGKTPWDFIKAAGYSYITAGENLAVDFIEAEAVSEAWMNSPGHKANIVNSHFEEIGIGIAQGEFEGHTAIFVVQMFGTPINKPVAVKTEPTPVAQRAPASAAPAAEVVKAPVPSAVPAPVQVSQEEPQVSLEPTPETVGIVRADIRLEPGIAIIDALTTSTANKVMAYFNGKAVLFWPREDNSWVAYIPLSILENASVSVVAYDIAGQEAKHQLASFTPNLQDTYNPFGHVRGEQIQLLGKTFEPKLLESKFYLLFVAVILSCLVIAIAVHRHVQHPQLVANSSFVVILAMLLWLG